MTDELARRRAAWAYHASIWEAKSRKVGNVSPRRPFADMQYRDFVVSAQALEESVYEVLRQHTPTVGELARKAIANRLRHNVAVNTNLGIVLLLAPLALCDTTDDIPGVVSRLTVEDCIGVYDAINAASAGGLGTRPDHDVASKPTVTLLEAMARAADNDLVARQYTTCYRDVIEIGIASLADGLRRGGCLEAAVAHCHMQLLGSLGDSLVLRKCGAGPWRRVRALALEVQAAGGIWTDTGIAAALDFDRHLRSESNRLNPGATADLVAATLYIAQMQNMIDDNTPFDWDEPGWTL